MYRGVPVAVVVPYDDYTAAFSGKSVKETTVPHEVAVRVLRAQVSPIRAWREYLGLSQAEVATRMEVLQSTFARMEAPSGKPSLNTLKKVAVAMGIAVEQLKW